RKWSPWGAKGARRTIGCRDGRLWRCGAETMIASREEVDVAVSEHEGTVLGMVARWQPLTRYQLLKAFERSPISSYNTSKGSLYPLVSRMIGRGFLITETGTGPR